MSYLIRHATVADAESLWTLYSDESAYSGTLQMPFPSLELWKTRLAQTDGNVRLVACCDAEVVGNAGLHTNTSPRRAHAASLGMAVRSAWQGKGVGTALLAAIVELADHWHGFARLELTVYTDNAPAIGLYQKAGFEIEGTLRGYALRRGRLADAFTMARIRPRP